MKPAGSERQRKLQRLSTVTSDENSLFQVKINLVQKEISPDVEGESNSAFSAVVGGKGCATILVMIFVFTSQRCGR